jgi:hypothetical protein
MKKIFCAFGNALIFLMLFSACTETALAMEEIKDIPSSIATVDDFANWLSSEFEYQWKLTKDRQAPDQTILSKQGNCEDFAVLASAFLSKIGIQNNIAIVSFNGISISHAISIWQDKEESYSFISNRSLHRTGKKTIEEAVGKYYPDWKKIVIANTRQNYIRVIRRK